MIRPRNWTGILSAGKFSPKRERSSSMLLPRGLPSSSLENSFFFLPSLGWIPVKVWPGMTPEPC